MSGTPDVSVITPARNAGPYIGHALASVALQSAKYEHLVVDDASTDDTRQIVLEWAKRYSNIRLICLDDCVGSIAARNIALQAARGRYLAFLDADDVWLPMKLETQLRYMKQKELAMTYTDYRHMSHDGSRVGRLICGPDSVDWHRHHTSRYIGCLTVMLDREKVGCFSFPTVKPAVRGEDFLAWSNVLRMIGAAHRCPGDLARYRLMRASRSSNKPKAVMSIWRLYRHVEKLDWHTALRLWVQFLVAAALKHAMARPRMKRELIDVVKESRQ